MSDTIKPCPWCGKTPDINDSFSFWRDGGGKWGSVQCCCIGPDVRTGYGPLEEWKDEAIAAWNTRVAAPAPFAPQSITDTIEAALIDSMQTRGAMTEDEYERWQQECQMALAWLDDQQQGGEANG